MRRVFYCHSMNYAVLLLVGLAFANCGSKKEAVESAEDRYKFSLQYEEKIDSIITLLTLEEKVALLHGNGMFWTAGVERLGIPEMQYADGPLGVREEIERSSWSPLGWTTDSATFFPAGGGLSASWNRELAMRYGEAIGAEARARNKDILLAPAINIIRTPLCGRNFEYFSEDPFLNARLTVPYVVGLQNQDVAACVKHYAVNNQETNRGTVDVLADERTIREIYLPAFKAAVEEGHAYSVMGAYNKFRGDYLCENDYMLNTILREQWGFKGVVVSDWGAVHSTVKAALNGLDIEMGTHGPFESFFFAQPLIDSVREGKLNEKIVDEKARNVLRVMYNINKIDSASRKGGAINSLEHRKVVYDVASESIVLLKNTGDLLPLKTNDLKSIAVIGDNAVRKHAAGGFGAGVKAKYEVTPLQGLQNKLDDKVEILYAQGYKEQYLQSAESGRQDYGLDPDNTPDAALLKEAVEIAKSSDVAIIVAGSNRHVESEAADRKNIQLPFGQEELIEAVKAVNPNTIVVVVAGAAFDLNRVEKASSALLWSWFNGSEAGNALADVLFGNVNPSGKMPWTLPKKLEDIPAHATNSFPGDEVVSYEEGILVGYRWFDTRNVEPLYPFGYGLSYTTFEYAGIGVDKEIYHRNETIHVTMKIKNSGKVSGKDIVQLYVQEINPSVQKAAKELKAFEKISINPGEEKEVAIALNVNDLAYFDQEKMEWVVSSGKYKILAGASSRDIRQEIEVEIK